MARIRTVKPEFFKHHELFLAEKESGLPLRVSFAGLWICCDKEGRFKWKPTQLKLDVIPYDECDFESVLIELVISGFVKKYESDGKEYGWIPTFRDHQRITGTEATADSKLPDPRNSRILETTRKQQGNNKEIQNDSEKISLNGSLSSGITLETTRKQQGNMLDDWKGKERKGIGKEGNGVMQKMTKEDLELFKTQLIQDVAFIEQVMQTRYIKELSIMLNWIKAFNVHITGEDKLDKDYPEYKRHFKNWIVMQDTSKPPPIGTPILAIPKTVYKSDQEIEAKYGKRQ